MDCGAFSPMFHLGNLGYSSQRVNDAPVITAADHADPGAGSPNLH
jgi:hypothetical protein